MKKTHKKIENTLRVVLTGVCHAALDQVEGFMWLTHTADYNHFPQSLVVTCVFKSDLFLERAKASKQDIFLRHQIKSALKENNINGFNENTFVKFTVEEAI